MKKKNLVDQTESLSISPPMDYKNISKQDLIDENRKLRLQLSEVEKKYKLFADNVSDVIWIFDFIHERFIFVSPSVWHLLGYSPEQALQLKWDEIVIPEEKEKFRGFMTWVLSNIKKEQHHHDKSFKVEVGECHQNGQTVWVEIKARFLFNGNGKPYLILGVSRDISDRKLAEEKLHQAYAHLEKMVLQRTSHLNEANITLKVLLDKREKDKQELEEKVALNLRELVLPDLEKLKRDCKEERQRTVLNTLEANIRSIISPLLRGLSIRQLKLSPMEIKVANLITHGKTNKDIAMLLHISLRTVEFHRRNIRNKIGIRNKKINLRTCLLSVQ